MNENKIIRRLSAIGIGGNILLVVFKLYAGITGRSGAMVSDAVHSMSDVLATLVAYIGVRVAKKAPDKDHPYGHDRFECLASLALGFILLATGVGIGYEGLKSIITGEYRNYSAPGMIALAAALVSIAAKEGMFRYTMHYAKKLNSSAFKADAWHHRSDALSSVGSLAGIIGARLGAAVMDSAAAVVISLFILKVGADIVRDAIGKMLDRSCGEEFENELSEFIGAQNGVERLDMLRTRQFGDKIYIDAEISVDGSLSLSEAHRIAESVHDSVESRYPDIKHIMIHENPTE